MRPNNRLSATNQSPPSVFAVAELFARYANTTFGGGSATIGVLHRELERRPLGFTWSY